MAKSNKPTVEQIEDLYSKATKKLKKEHLPKALLVGGVSASGKSVYLEELKIKEPNFLYIQPDKLRKEHPDYAEFEKKYGREQASGKTGAFSNIFAQELLQKATADGYNICYETTLKNLDRVNGFVANLHRHGYQIDLKLIVIPRKESMLRSASRFNNAVLEQNTIPRQLSEKVITEQSQNIPHNIAELLKNEKIHNITVDDNTRRDFKEVFNSQTQAIDSEQLKQKVSDIIEGKALEQAKQKTKDHEI